MHDGRIEQWDSAYTLYHWPATPFVADFVGEGVLLPGELRGPRSIEVEGRNARKPPHTSLCGRDADCRTAFRSTC
jgi:ABC-type Fe3+/spermidine/putrescine transport system ATPase subunit